MLPAYVPAAFFLYRKERPEEFTDAKEKLDAKLLIQIFIPYTVNNGFLGQ